jgi:hypothetical protein
VTPRGHSGSIAVSGLVYPVAYPAAAAGERQLLAPRTIAHVASHFIREGMCAYTIEVNEEVLTPQ